MQDQRPLLLYVVTALVSCEEPVCPQIVGIFTTVPHAIREARAFFATHSQSYCIHDDDGGGSFEAVHGVLGQQDLTANELLKLTEQRPARRILLEDFGGCNGGDSVVVAINAVRCNNNNNVANIKSQTIPLLYCPFWRSSSAIIARKKNGGYGTDTTKEGNTNIAIVSTKEEDDDDEPNQQEEQFETNENKKVHVLVSGRLHCEDCEGGGENPSLIGVFLKKEDGLEAAKADFAKKNRNNIDNVFDNTKKIRERGRVLWYDDDERGEIYGIAMDTFVLDEVRTKEDLKEGKGLDDKNNDDSYYWDYLELDLGPSGSGLYHFPRIEGYDEVQHTKACSICEEEKKYEFYEGEEWNNSDDEHPPICNACRNEMTKTCASCKLPVKYRLYKMVEWNNPDGYNTCSICLKSKFCSSCNTKLPKDKFTKQEYKKINDKDRICNDCQNMQATTTTNDNNNTDEPPSATTLAGEKRPANDELNQDGTTTNNKKQKLFTKQCNECGLEKSRKEFSNTQWRKNAGRCKLCIVSAHFS